MNSCNSEVYFFWTESPLHVGGGSDTGAIDLPVQRDRQTGHPVVNSSGVKGALRDHCRQLWDDTKLNAIFGPDGDDHFAGAISFSEMRTLLFPVRSLQGVFAWITCPLALARLKRDMSRVGYACSELDDDLSIQHNTALIATNCPNKLPENNSSKQVVLEEYCYAADDSQSDKVYGLAGWLKYLCMPKDGSYGYWRDGLCNPECGNSKLIILGDDDFTYFVKYSTNVAQRIRIDADTGTAAGKGLWTEESLPSDCLLYCVSHAGDTRSDKWKKSADCVKISLNQALSQCPMVQIGGDETVGRGLTRVRIFNS